MDIKSLLEQLKLRNVRKTLTIYLSSALTTVGVIKLLQEVYSIPSFLFPAAVTLLIFGIGNALIYAWYHGMEGEQKVRKSEMLLHTLFFGVGILLAFRAAESPRRPEFTFSEKSIAVLPFKNLSESKEDEYFSDGIMEDILTQLSKIGDLRVISRTTAMKYKDTQKSIREIGEELGVATVLEGSVRRDGNRVRIAGQLIDAKTDEHVWAETYDREMRNVFEIQSDVARQIAAALKAALSPEEIKLIEHKPTENLEAYAFYLKGRDHYYKYQAEDNQKAIGLFKQALSLDSNYALAYAGLGDAYCQNAQRFNLPTGWFDSAMVVSKKSIELNPSLAEGHKALALAYEGKTWQQQALEEYLTAVRLNPNYVAAIGNIGNLHQQMGNLDEALRWSKKAVSLSPDRTFAYVSVAIVYQMLTMDSLAISWYQKAQTIDPEQLFTTTQLGWLYLMRGELDNAKALKDTVLARDPNWPLGLDFVAGYETFAKNYKTAEVYYDTLRSWGMFEASYQLGYVLLKQGKTKRGHEVLQATLQTYLREMGDGGSGYSNLETAIVYSLLDNPSEAKVWLRRAIDKGYRDYRWLQVDPRLEQLHVDQEFVELMMGLKRRVDAMRDRVIQNEGSM